jgi:hypothetical protein
MKLSRAIKEDIAKKAAIATIAKRRDAAYKTLQKELTRIAELQYTDVPLNYMAKFADYIVYENNLQCGKNYPEDFIEIEKQKRRDYKDFGFVPSGDVPLLKHFPCKANEYYIHVSDEYAEDYTKAVRKYMLLYFEAITNYKLILEGLNTISTDKELEDEFPELVIFFTLPEDDKKRPIISKERISKCKSLLKENRHLFVENL